MSLVLVLGLAFASWDLARAAEAVLSHVVVEAAVQLEELVWDERDSVGVGVFARGGRPSRSESGQLRVEERVVEVDRDAGVAEAFHFSSAGHSQEVARARVEVAESAGRGRRARRGEVAESQSRRVREDVVIVASDVEDDSAGGNRRHVRGCELMLCIL